ncbi:hypothetical protein LIER_41085 [Lithospermum erythrorhizon]|uniref:Gag-pol polyprotein n=1 Tax=Lithospermum erythrorhizon TaxID=34254 RepID=A0AAV3R582_LITER
MRIIVERDEEIQNLNAQLKSLNKGMMMMNSSTNILQDILEVGKFARDNTGIGYKKGKFSKQKEEMKFVPAGGHQLSITSRTTSGYRKRNNRIWYCHYCAKKGHISPYWYKVYGPRRTKIDVLSIIVVIKQLWKTLGQLTTATCRLQSKPCSKQGNVTDSTTEVEYIAACEVAKEAS